ncbi:MAG TPA: ABC transporter permease subunit, partial [Sphaerochaeta sp.]|nr:ABC transporter permease subunit [Sphaerochaeta sp.]
LSMIPYIIPGAVIGVALIMSFNNKYLPLVGTATIMIVAMSIRRIPYVIRSSVAILSQIPLSIDEAAESLGAGKVKTLVKITVPMMLNGIFAGAIMSWVTLITELSSSILLYSFRTQTLNVAIYTMVAKGADGRACALSTILMIFTVLTLVIFNKFSKDGELML